MKAKLHPELDKVKAIWKQIKVLKEEDCESYVKFMLRIPNESQQAVKDRAPGFVRGFINPTQMLLRSKGDAVFKKEVQRRKLSAGQDAFAKRADRSGQTLHEIMQNEVAPSLAAYGTVFAIMDKPPGPFANKQLEFESGLPFLTILDPMQVIWFSWAKDGKLDWFMYYVNAPDDTSDPWNIQRDPKWKTPQGIALWTRTKFSVRSPNNKNLFYVPPTPHDFGCVPVIIQAQYLEPGHTVGASTFFSSSDYIVMSNNLENASNNEVFKNANSTLTMDIEDWDDEQQPVHERNPQTNLKELTKQTHDVKNVMLYKTNKPEYMTRDLKLIELAAARAKKYFDLAVDNEKNALSVKQISLPQSGVSKGYDFVDVNNMLSGFATALERFEVQAIGMGGDMLDEASAFEIVYPQDFDVGSFLERLDFVQGLKTAAFPSKTGMREAYKTLVPQITPDPDKQAAINKEIDSDKLEVAAVPAPAASPAAETAPGALPASSSTATAPGSGDINNNPGTDKGVSNGNPY